MINRRKVLVDECLPIQLADGLRIRGVKVKHIKESFKQKTKDDYIAGHLNGSVLITRDQRFAEKLGDQAIHLKYHMKLKRRYTKIPKEPEETIKFKIKRQMRMMFCTRIQEGHKVKWVYEGRLNPAIQ